MPEVTAEMLRRGRNIADMDAALRAERDGLVFMETSPKKEPVIVYSMVDGEPIPMAPHIAEMAMKKRLKDGTYLFTDKKEDAPEYKYGTVKCFLHPEAPEREILDEIGLAGVTCQADHLASLYSKRIHGQRRHRQEWETLQEHRQLVEREQERAERKQQLEATLSLVGTPRNPVGRPPKARQEDTVQEKVEDAGSPPLAETHE